jgi:hypothetical protein
MRHDAMMAVTGNGSLLPQELVVVQDHAPQIILEVVKRGQRSTLTTKALMADI